MQIYFTVNRNYTEGGFILLKGSNLEHFKDCNVLNWMYIILFNFARLWVGGCYPLHLGNPLQSYPYLIPPTEVLVLNQIEQHLTLIRFLLTHLMIQWQIRKIVKRI